MYKIIFSLLMASFSLMGTAQSVGIGTNTPASSAQLEINSTTKGLLPPRMTFVQRNAIQSSVAGLMVYCTDCGINGGEPQYYNGTNWLNMIGGNASIPSVGICDQLWATQNLDVSTYRDGTVIPEVPLDANWATLTTGAWCYYANDPANGVIYGKLYNWYAVAGIYDAASFNNPSLRKKLAPQGWHVPSDPEWNILTKCIDPSADTTTGTNIAGTAMKSTSGWNSGGNGTNSSGFAGLPGGIRNGSGPFGTIGYSGYWWSSTEKDASNAFYRNLFYNGSNLRINNLIKIDGFSVRCLRD